MNSSQIHAHMHGEKERELGKTHAFIHPYRDRQNNPLRVWGFIIDPLFCVS